jgi:hypothetical protein
VPGAAQRSDAIQQPTKMKAAAVDANLSLYSADMLLWARYTGE